MRIDTEGTYTLRYTAEDECGNIATADRTVVVTSVTYRTVRYTDGTLIINEKSSDTSANVALHGSAANVYAPFNPNGSTDVAKYIFSGANKRPWHSQRASIKRVEIGANILPPSTAYWFSGFSTCTSMNLSKLNTSNVTSMSDMFSNCSALTSLDLSHFNTSNVTDMKLMFWSCQTLTSLDVSSFNTGNVTDMTSMFNNCTALTSLDLSGFNTSNVTDMSNMFSSCNALTSLDVSHFSTSNVTSMRSMFIHCYALALLDLSNFNTSNVTNMNQMFMGCPALKTIYASANFVVAQVTDSDNMFKDMSTNLVGGAGTTWTSSNPTNKTYAHIDGGTADPGYFTAKP